MVVGETVLKRRKAAPQARPLRVIFSQTFSLSTSKNLKISLPFPQESLPYLHTNSLHL